MAAGESVGSVEETLPPSPGSVGGLPGGGLQGGALEMDLGLREGGCPTYSLLMPCFSLLALLWVSVKKKFT